MNGNGWNEWWQDLDQMASKYFVKGHEYSWRRESFPGTLLNFRGRSRRIWLLLYVWIWLFPHSDVRMCAHARCNEKTYFTRIKLKWQKKVTCVLKYQRIHDFTCQYMITNSKKQTRRIKSVKYQNVCVYNIYVCINILSVGISCSGLYRICSATVTSQIV